MISITSQNFKLEYFRKFLLTTILDEVFYCNAHRTAQREYMTAFGRLMNEFYIVQIRSDDITYEDVQIIQLPLSLVDELLRAIHPKW